MVQSIAHSKAARNRRTPKSNMHEGIPTPWIITPLSQRKKINVIDLEFSFSSFRSRGLVCSDQRIQKAIRRLLQTPVGVVLNLQSHRIKDLVVPVSDDELAGPLDSRIANIVEHHDAPNI